MAAVAIPSVRAMELFRLFDSLETFGYSMCCLFEDSTPGAESALIAWAEAHGHAWSQRTVTPPGAPPVIATKIDVMRNGRHGAHISVQRLVRQ